MAESDRTAPPTPRSHWAGSALVGAAFGALLATNLAVAFLVPDLLGYPTGGIFLLDRLPLIAAGIALAALLCIPAALASRGRVGIATAIACTLALAALSAANAYLWVLCVSSV